MPYLSFESPPPSSRTIDLSNPDDTTDPPAKVDAKLNPKPVQDPKATRSETNFVEDPVTNAYPVVRLDADAITDAAAGRLAASLLGHVLFLKNQIPFPVMQLGRIPGGKANSRASKQRAELLASYDTISSHFDTTFSALSTALARCADRSGQRKVAQAHVAILVGPSLGSAKSKVILGIDGLETRIWGTRDDAARRTQDQSDDSDEEEEEEEEEDGESSEENDEGAEEPEESEDEDEEGDDDNSEEDDEDDVEDEDDQENVVKEKTMPPPPPPYISYAEEQKFLHNAERLLSRTLAAADAEGSGITSEMSPTQTHILIRAPRKFNHPAWIPRQNISDSLDASLQEFLRDSGVMNSDIVGLESRSKASSKKTKVEGVWVSSRAGIHGKPAEDSSKPVLQSKEEEDTDMIWWSWDGKFVGFADW